MGEQDLYAGETLLVTKRANAVISVANYGLAPGPWDPAMRALGMAGREAIGGWLDVTNWRLIFRSHKLNRISGRFSILLPTVADATNSSGLITKKLRVVTRMAVHEFVIWGVPGVLLMINEARAAADSRAILAAVEASPRLLGSGLERTGNWEAIVTGAGLAYDVITNPIDAATVLNVWEFLRSVKSQ